MASRVLSLAVLLVLAGCASLPFPARTSVETPAGQDGHYDPEPGRDATFVARMRAAPPSDQPEMRDGKTLTGDLRALNNQGYVRIGVGHYRADDPAARGKIGEKARAVGADRVLLYRTSIGSRFDATTLSTEAANTADAELRAVFFVHLRLPFGATFRDLKTVERARLGGRDGVQIGSVIGDTPASEANLQPGDFVLAIDGNAVRDKLDFQNRLKASAGQRVTLTVHRNGNDMQRMVRLGTIAADQP